MLVDDAKPIRAVVLSDRERLDGTLHVLHLERRRLQAPIRVDDAVADELAVVRQVALVVAAVGPRGHAVNLLGQRLVCPVPDEPSLTFFVLLKRPPVFVNIARTVPHGVRVLAQHDGPPVVDVLGQRDDLADTRVHRTDDVRRRSPTASSLVLDGARRVTSAEVPGHRQVCGAVAGLVPERPADDRGVVLVALVHPHAAIDDGCDPIRAVGRVDPVVGQRGVKPVALHVGLVDHVEPIQGADRVPKVVVGVVRAAHGVEVEPLDERGVALHGGRRDDPRPVVGRVLVPGERTQRAW